MSEPLRTADQATPTWLTQQLRQAGVSPQGEVTAVSVEPGHRSEISSCYHLVVTYGGGALATAPRQLFLKISGRESPQDDREVLFYRHLAPTLSSPAFLSALSACFCQEQQAYHLLLSDVSSSHILRPDWHETAWFRAAYSHRTVTQLMSGLAAFHGRFWQRTDLSELPTQLDLTFTPEDIRGTYQALADKAPVRLAELGSWLTSAQRQMISRLAEGGPELLARRVTDGPLTLVHGDANSMNLVVPRDTEKGQALILDWATYAQSFGPDDVATYLAPFWYPRLRRQLEIPALQAYHRGLLEGGVQDYTWDSCWDDYRLGIVSRMLYRLRQPPLADHIGLWILENTLAAFEELDCAELLG